MKSLIKISIFISIIIYSSCVRDNTIEYEELDVFDNDTCIDIVNLKNKIDYIDSVRILEIPFSPNPKDLEVLEGTYDGLLYKIEKGIIYKYFEDRILDTIKDIKYIAIENGQYFYPVLGELIYYIQPGDFKIKYENMDFNFIDGKIIKSNDTLNTNFGYVKLIVGKHAISSETHPKYDFCKIIEIEKSESKIPFLLLTNISVKNPGYKNIKFKQGSLPKYFKDFTTNYEYESVFSIEGNLFYFDSLNNNCKFILLTSKMEPMH